MTQSPQSSSATEPPIDVMYIDPGGAGWGPVERLAVLASRVLNGRLLSIRYRRGDRHLGFYGARQHFPRLRGGTRVALIIAPRPEHLTAILRFGAMTTRYAQIVGWVIDSFWHDRIPAVARHGRFDRLYVMDDDDLGPWRDACPATTVGVLPWGCDALNAERAPKTVDVQRLGRMPTAWDDDDVVRATAAAHNLEFRGRPPFGSDNAESHTHVLRALSAARFVLAFSNLASPAGYTHPTRDYLTARWTDGLAHGAVIAGAAPTSGTARKLLWPGATIELSPTDRDAALAELAEAALRWRPDDAERNRREARRLLDWRHRLSTIADDLSLPAPLLDQELALLAGP